MIEYPTILHPSRAPRESCIGFEKLDGSNIRVKYTTKKGFSLFGSRTQLFDEKHPHLGESINIFYKKYEKSLLGMIEKYWPNEREIVAFLEFFGKKSFAGLHEENDPKDLVLFDLMIGHKNRKFLLPQEFVKICRKSNVEIPQVLYIGNFNEQLIEDVRSGKYPVIEGMICKGTERTGAARGNVWMAKIKTRNYLELLKQRFGEKEAEKYGE